jgi:hypothetical protein
MVTFVYKANENQLIYYFWTLLILSLMRIVLIFILLCAGLVSRGQVDTLRKSPEPLNADTNCFQEDVFDILTKKKLKAPEIPSRKVRAIILPLIASSPATGLQLGAGSSVSWTFGKNPDTKMSAGTVQLLWTTQRQLISYIRTTMFLNGNRMFIQTDWRWYLFRLPTYGLGTGPKDNIPVVTDENGVPENDLDYRGGKFHMKYKWIKFHNVIYHELAPHIYGGLGYHLDSYYDIEDDDLHLDSTGNQISPHYAYCNLHGFNPARYITSGLSLNAAYDTRDNIINAYKGIYASVSYRYNFTMLGSARNGSQLWTEFRTYIGLSENIPRHVLAFWVFGNFKTSGEIPYLNLMSSGFDQSNSSGRGYAQGRWRGEDFVYGEVEYRFPISPCTGIVGGVLFANLSTASNRDMQIPLFGYFRPGAGFGLRIMVGKHDRTNLLIDFGLGELSSGLYLQAQEVF